MVHAFNFSEHCSVIDSLWLKGMLSHIATVWLSASKQLHDRQILIILSGIQNCELHSWVLRTDGTCFTDICIIIIRGTGSLQMGGLYCFTVLHLYTLPNAGSCKHEGAFAELSDVNNYEKFRHHWLQQLQYSLLHRVLFKKKI